MIFFINKYGKTYDLLNIYIYINFFQIIYKIIYYSYVYMECDILITSTYYISLYLLYEILIFIY